MIEDIEKLIADAREAGRDVPLVTEELLHALAAAVNGLDARVKVLESVQPASAPKA